MHPPSVRPPTQSSATAEAGASHAETRRGWLRRCAAWLVTAGAVRCSAMLGVFGFRNAVAEESHTAMLLARFPGESDELYEKRIGVAKQMIQAGTSMEQELSKVAYGGTSPWITVDGSASCGDFGVSDGKFHSIAHPEIRSLGATPIGVPTSSTPGLAVP